MINKLKNLMYQTGGKFTDDLALEYSSVKEGYLPKRLKPESLTSMVCGYCSTGCSLDVHIKDGKPVNLTPTIKYPVNLGEACPKGWESLTPLKARDRATTPYIRNKDGKLVRTDWDSALTKFTDKFKKIQKENGDESVAFISTGQIPTEEMALLGALAKFGMGIKHGDGNTRQCMASAVVAYKQSFGFDAPPYTYKDFEESDCLIFVGANPCIAHPIMWQRVEMNKNDPKVIVIDPRMTETAMVASNHYALTPKSDLVLFYGIANILIKNSWIDQDYITKHTNDFEKFKAHIKDYTPQMVSSVSGLTISQLEEFTYSIHSSKKVSFWWTMGVNQSYEGVRVAQALINIALLTGNIGREGTGANSITGQCNAMGSRLFSNTTNLLGHHDFLSDDDRARVAEVLDISEDLIPKENSLSYDKIIEGVGQGKIKGLWVIATNPAHSWINQNEFHDVIKNLDFLVVQDMYHTTETAQVADLILPAAGWGEKEGTFINSERRFGLLKRVAQAPGEALADFYIFKLIARYWGCDNLFKSWESPEDCFQTLKELSKGKVCDFTGIDDYKMLNDCGGIQWPFPKGSKLTSNERRLFEDGNFYHADKRAKFIFEKPRDNPEPTDEEYPFMLLTGRGTSSQWHTQTRTGKSKILQKMYPHDVYVEINTDDAQRLSIMQGDLINIATRRGKIKAYASVVRIVKPGQIFIPMHYPQTNRLTFPSFDPYSRQPSYKISAAKVSRQGQY